MKHKTTKKCATLPLIAAGVCTCMLFSGCGALSSTEKSGSSMADSDTARGAIESRAGAGTSSSSSLEAPLLISDADVKAAYANVATEEQTSPNSSTANNDDTSGASSSSTSVFTRNRSFMSDQSQPKPKKQDESRQSTALVGLFGQLNDPSAEKQRQPAGAVSIAQVSFATEGACFDPAVNPQGDRLAFASTMHRETSDIYLKATAGKTVTQLTSDPADDIMPAFSPDGTMIAFASNRSGNWDLFIVDAKGGRPIQLTNSDEHDLHPSWSPDGDKIVFCRFGERSGRWELWVTEANNPSVQQFLEYGVFPQWSPDVADNRILFQRARERGSRYHSVWTIEYHDGEARKPTEIVSASNAATINPAWAPDGSRIVFATVIEPKMNNDSGEAPKQSDIWTVNVDGTDRTNLTAGEGANFQPVWGPDGRVFFVSNRSGTDNIWAVWPSGPGNAIPGEGASDVANVDGAARGDQP